ncbi:MAG: hypothetical protein CBHOC_2744 [uncultured Caballeronia sp.]|nr:MAG: hypothetical protein CBHOC_2744 [uncultured Caballeronia sp.]
MRHITCGSAIRILRQSICWFAAVTCLVVYVHLPLTIRTLNMHDDGLFIKLGEYLARGQWLGSFDQLTLAKGPGYPMFLAVNAWIGTSVSVSETLLLLGATALTFRYIKAIFVLPNAAAAGFIFTVCCPILYFSLILRDAIYPSQTLLIFALSLSLAFLNDARWLKFLKSLVLGAITAWFWLTREEGIWILPPMGVLILSAILYSCSKQRTLRILFSFGLGLLVVLACQSLYKAINDRYYGYPVAVDVKEKNFVSALDALQSVHSGPTISMVPVTRNMRIAVRQVSPTFASIADYFDPPNGTPWQYGCKFYPNTCGDIAGGWFIWALRDAAAQKGHYQSPRAASDFFGAMAQEIHDACARNKLRCGKNWIPYMPRLSPAQARQLPASLWSGVSALMFSDTTFNLASSTGDDQSLWAASRFLGSPPYNLSVQQTVTNTYLLQGWYLAPGGAWLSARFWADSTDASEVVDIPRSANPDLAAGFKDPNANLSRFDFRVTCANPCPIIFSAHSIEVGPVNLESLAGSRLQRSLGDGTLNFDTTAKMPRVDAPDFRSGFSERWVLASVHLYERLMKPLTVLSLFALVASVIIRVVFDRASLLSPTMSIPAVVWIFIATRLLLLALIDVSSFPAIRETYLSPLYPLLTIAITTSLMSLGCAVSLRRSLRLERADRTQ